MLRRVRNRSVVLLLAFVLAPAVSVGLSGVAAGHGSLARERAPVTQLPPGLVILANAKTPQGVVEIGLHRIRYLGKVRLCLNEADQPNFPSGGPETCANYPVGPSSGQGIDHTHLFMGPVFSGVCSHRQFMLYAAVVLRHGLTAWLQSTDLREARMRAVAVPKAFDVSGPLVYEVVRDWHPLAILLRDSSGRTVSHVSVLKGGFGGCYS